MAEIIKAPVLKNFGKDPLLEGGQLLDYIGAINSLDQLDLLAK